MSIAIGLQFTDTSSFFEELESTMVESVRKRMELFAVPALQARLAKGLHGTDAPSSVYTNGNTTDKLYSRTGTLLRATVKGQKGNIFDLDVTPAGGKFTFGIDPKVVPYATAHNYGAEFVQTVTPKQRKFFWFRYLQTQDERWMAMAMSKQLNIKMKARPFWEPALKEFFSEDVNFLLKLIVRDLKDAL